MGFPLLYPLTAALIFELGSKGGLSIVLSPFFYLASMLWIVTGIGLQTLRHWSWYTFGAAQVLAAYYNAYILVNYSESQFKGFAFVFALGVQYFLFRLVAREVRVPYLFPRIHWWESGIAGIHHLQVDFEVGQAPGTPQKGTQKGQLLDLSTRGCFIKCPQDFTLGDSIEVRFSAYGNEFSLPGSVVWNAKSTVTHPKGIGVQFRELDRPLKRQVRIASKQFNQEKEG